MDESLPESDPFFDDDDGFFESDFSDDWGENDRDDVETPEEETVENTEYVENFSEGGEGAEHDIQDDINTKPTSLNWKWDDFGWGGIGSADNDDDSDDEDIFDSDEDENITTEENDLVGSSSFEAPQGRSGMMGGRSFAGFADFANGLGLADDTADKLRPTEDNDPEIQEVDNRSQDDKTDEVEHQEDSVVVLPVETESNEEDDKTEGEKEEVENNEDQEMEDDGDVTSDEEDEDDDHDGEDSSDEEDTENDNSDETTGDVEKTEEEENEGEETFVTPGPEEEGEQAGEGDEEPKEDSNNLDKDFDDSRHDSKDPEVYPTISTTKKTTSTTTSSTIAATTIATTKLASRYPVVITTKDPTTK